MPGSDDNWLLGVLQGLLVVALGIPIGFGLKRVAAALFVEWDRSALIRVDFGSECEARLFSDVPIVVGNALLGDYDKSLAPTIDPKKVLGFVIGQPRMVECPARIGLKRWAPGYYAYVVIRWEHFDEFKRLAKMGFYVSKKFVEDDDGGPRVDLGESRMLVFRTASEGVEGVADIIGGIRGSMRYQPYLSAGFNATDLDHRKLTPQSWVFWKTASALIGAKNWLKRAREQIRKI